MRHISIRLGREDLRIVQKVMKEKSWDRSRAIRHVIRLIGTLLVQGKIDYEGEDVVQIPMVPDRCPDCKSPIRPRSEINPYEDDYDQLWICKNGHLFQAIYRVTIFRELKAS